MFSVYCIVVLLKQYFAIDFNHEHLCSTSYMNQAFEVLKYFIVMLNNLLWFSDG